MNNYKNLPSQVDMDISLAIRMADKSVRWNITEADMSDPTASVWQGICLDCSCARPLRTRTILACMAIIASR
jgi:hypothetical protein